MKKSSNIILWGLVLLAQLFTHAVHAQKETQFISLDTFPGRGDVPGVVVTDERLTVEVSSSANIQVEVKVIEGKDLIIASYDDVASDGFAEPGEGGGIDDDGDGNVYSDLVVEGGSNRVIWTPKLRKDPLGRPVGGGTIKLRLFARETTSYFPAELTVELVINPLESNVFWDTKEEPIFGTLGYDLLGDAVARNVNRDDTGQFIVYTVADGPGIIKGNTLYAYEQGTVTVLADAIRNSIYGSSSVEHSIVFNNVELGTGAAILDQWTTRNPNPTGQPAYNNILSANGVYIAVGDFDGSTAKITTSTDGVTWTDSANTATKDIHGISFNGKRSVGTINLLNTPTLPDTNIDQVFFDQIEINGIIFSFREQSRSPTEFAIGSDANATVRNMLSVLNSSIIPNIAEAAYSTYEVEVLDDVSQANIPETSPRKLIIARLNDGSNNIVFRYLGNTGYNDITVADTVPAVKTLINSITLIAGTPWNDSLINEDERTGILDSASAITNEIHKIFIVHNEIGLVGDSFTYNDVVEDPDVAANITFEGSSLANGDILFVTAGEEGQVLYRNDTLNWTIATTNINTAHDLRDIAYDATNDVFVAVGADTGNNNGAVVWYSPNEYAGAGNWTEVSLEFNFLKGLKAIAMDDTGVAVAVGEYGTVYRTTDVTDPNSWKLQLFFGTTNSFNDVVYGNNEFILVGDGGEIHSSTTGQGWIPRFSNQNKNLNAIDYVNYELNKRVYVAAGDDGVVLTSLDGQQWIERDTRLPYNANGITVSENTFYTVGNSFSILTSPSGEAWTIRETANPGALTDVVYHDGLYIGVGSADVAGNEARILRSTDGYTWSDSEVTIPGGAKGLNGVAYDSDNSMHVAVGNSGTILTSINNGNSWTRETDVNFVVDPDNPPGSEIDVNSFSTNLNSVHFADDRFVAVGEQRSILTSTDGVTWSLGAQGAAENINDIIYGNGRWVAVGGITADGITGTAYVSDDGYRWDDRFLVNDSTNLNGVTYFRGSFYAVGDDGVIVSSIAGNTPWTHLDSNCEFDLNAITADNNNLFVVGQVLSVLTSDDGFNWETRISGSLNELHGITVGDNLLVTVGDFDLIYTTSDGVNSGLDNWDLATTNSPSTPNVNDVIFANDTYVAVGDDGLIRSSFDGVNWQDRSIEGITDDFSTVSFGDGLFLAASSNENGLNAIITSSDGKDWELTYTWWNPINEIAYGEGLFIAAGDGGALYNITIVDRQSGKVIIKIDNSDVFEHQGGGSQEEDYKGVSYFEELGLFVLVGSSSVYEGNYLVDDIPFVSPIMSFLATSFDGMSWQRQFVPLETTEGFIVDTLTSVSYGPGPYHPLYSTDPSRPELPTDGRFVITSEEGRVLSAYNLFTRFEPVSVLSDTEIPTTYFLGWDIFGGVSFSESLYEAGNGNPGYVVVGENGSIYTSVDAVNWTFVFNGTVDKLNSVAYGNLNGQETFIAVGDAGRVLNSTNRRDWNDIRTIDAINSLNGFAAGRGDIEALVAVGNEGSILQSTDGSNWTKVDVDTQLDFNGVAFGNEAFVGVNDAGLTAYSEDGLTWSLLASGTTNNLNDVDFSTDNQVFIAVGDAGVYTVSSGGIPWAQITNLLDEDLLGVSIREREKATGSIQITSVPAALETIEVDVDGVGALDSVELTFVDENTIPLNNQVQILPTDTVEDVVNKTAAKLLSNVPEANFVANGDTIQIVFKTLGASGNDMTLAGTAPISNRGFTGSVKFNEVPADDGSQSITFDLDGTGPIASTTLTYVSTVPSATEVQVVNGDTIADIVRKTIAKIPYNGADVIIVQDGDTIDIMADVADYDITVSGTAPVTVTEFDTLTGGVDELFMVVGDNGYLAMSSDAETWTPATTSITSPLYDIAYGNRTFVAVGQEGMILTSPDGRNWTQQNANIIVDLEAVDFADGYFVMVGGDATIFTSVDGVTWIPRPSNSFAGLRDVGFSNNTYFAVGEFGTIISSGAFVFKQEQTINFPELNDFDFPADRNSFTLQATAPGGIVTYVVAGNATLDGDLLTVTGLGEITVIASQAGNDLFNAAPDVVRTFQVNDASNKTNQLIKVNDELVDPEIPILTQVFEPNSSITLEPVAVSAEDTNIDTNLLVTLQLRSGLASLDNNILAIEGAGEIIIDATVASNETYNTLTTSFRIVIEKAQDTISFPSLAIQSESGDEVTLAEVNEADKQLVLSASTESGRAVRFIRINGPGEIEDGTVLKFTNSGNIRVEVTVAEGEDYLADTKFLNLEVEAATSGDIYSILNSGVTSNLNAVEFLNQEYVAVGDEGVILTSSNGVDWTKRVSGAYFFNGVAYGLAGNSGIYVTVGNSGALVTSADGEIWVEGDSGVTSNLNDVAYVNSRFVAIGDGGVVLVSLDGTEWESVTTGVSTNFLDITYGNDLYIIVGSGGSIVRSGDLSAFDETLAPTSVTFNTVVFDGTRFTIGGTSNALYTTENGIALTLRNSPVDTILSMVRSVLTNDTDKFILTGPSGFVATSDGDFDWRDRNSGVADNLNDVVFASELFVAVGDAGAIVSSGTLSTRKTQTITTAIGTPITVGSPIEISASSKDDLDVDTELPLTYTVVQGDAVIDDSGTPVTITVNTDGVIIYRVSQAGNSDYYPALDAQETFNAGTIPEITFPDIGDRVLESGAFTLSATVTPSNLTLSYEITAGSNIATLSGATLTPLGTGSVTVKAFVAGRTDIAEETRTFVIKSGILAQAIVETQTDIAPGLTFVGAAVGTDDTLVAIASDGTILVDAGGDGNYDFGTVVSGTRPTSMTDVAFGNGYFVAVGNNGAVMTSTDGVSWTVVLTQFVAVRNYTKIIYAENRFVAIGTGGKAFYSSTSPSIGSFSLTEAVVSNSVALNDLAWGNGTFVAVGSGGIAFSSGNGSSWSANNLPIFDVIRGVEYGNGVFLAVGNSGRRIRSTDGSIWSVLTPLNLADSADNTQNLFSVAFDGTLFNIVGNSGLFLQTTGLGAGNSPGNLSPTFTKVQMAANTSFEAIDFQQSRLVATGPDLLLANSAPNFVEALFGSAEVVSGDWLEAWIGFFVDFGEINNNDYYYHSGLEWLIADEATRDDIGGFFYSPEIGWFWTSVDAFPWLWVEDAQAWYYFDTSTGTNYYYNTALGWVLAPVSL